MSKTIKLTAKRQATFPAELCRDLDLAPGDEIQLEPRLEEGKPCWVLQKREASSRTWTGTLNQYAGNVSDHSMDAIRESIKSGRRSDT